MRTGKPLALRIDSDSKRGAANSGFGTFETCPGGLMMSVVRGRPEVIGTQPN
jgi:hypothetical protein